MVTEAEAQSILAELKVIGANLSWTVDGVIRRLEAKALCVESEQILTLKGTWGKTNRSFALLYKNTPIRKYTVHASHRDPVTREVVRQPHKHTWDEEYQDRQVYIPDDIRIGNLNEELMDFLKECNIDSLVKTRFEEVPAL